MTARLVGRAVAWRRVLSFLEEEPSRVGALEAKFTRWGQYAVEDCLRPAVEITAALTEELGLPLSPPHRAALEEDFAAAAAQAQAQVQGDQGGGLLGLEDLARLVGLRAAEQTSARHGLLVDLVGLADRLGNHGLDLLCGRLPSSRHSRDGAFDVGELASALRSAGLRGMSPVQLALFCDELSPSGIATADDLFQVTPPPPPCSFLPFLLYSSSSFLLYFLRFFFSFICLYLSLGKGYGCVFEGG